MAGMVPEGSQFDARQFDTKMNELLSSDGQDFFTSYDEVYDSFDALGLQENLLRGIYAYGFEKPSAMERGRTNRVDDTQQAESETKKSREWWPEVQYAKQWNRRKLKVGRREMAGRGKRESGRGRKRVENRKY